MECENASYETFHRFTISIYMEMCVKILNYLEPHIMFLVSK